MEGNSSAAKVKGSFLILDLKANMVGLETARGFEPLNLDVREKKPEPLKVTDTRMAERRERKRRMEGNKGRKPEGRGRRRRAESKAKVCVPPPQYFVKLLGFLGWKIEQRDGFDGFVYVSPQGLVCSSIPKLFEFFLHRCWKTENVAHILTSTAQMAITAMEEDPIDCLPLAVEHDVGPKNSHVAEGEMGVEEPTRGENVAVAESSGSAVAIGRRSTRSMQKIGSKEGRVNVESSLQISDKLHLQNKKRKSTDCSGNAKGRKRKRKGGFGIRTKRKGEVPSNGVSEPNANVLSWLIDAGVLAENEKVVHKLKRIGKKRRLMGFITRGGIRCSCCKQDLRLSEFDAHAGSEIHRPWSDISRVGSGESLLESLTTAWNKVWALKSEEEHNISDGDLDSSDDICGICADGGYLICCDNCSSTFHQDCVSLQTLPEGNWYCAHCKCKFCNEASQMSNGNCLATELYKCSQCSSKYHLECIEKDDLLRTGGQLTSLCGNSCKKVDAELSNMIGVLHPIKDGFSWTLLKRCDDDQRIAREQRSVSTVLRNIQLSVALSVLGDCFNPPIDRRTGIDVLSQAVYNCRSRFKRLSYEGFYTIILQKDDEIISAATLRIHGPRFAEMPFIGTRTKYRRKGMCTRLLGVIHDMLSSLQVQHLIIPSIPELVQTWTTSFQFKPLEEHVRDDIRTLGLVVFPGTILLQKTIIWNEKEGCPNQENNAIEGCADEWIEILTSADESWFTSSYCCISSDILNHQETGTLPANLSEVGEGVENKDDVHQDPCLAAGTPPVECTAGFYTVPLSATEIGTPTWFGEPQATKDSDNVGRVCFSTRVKRKLGF